jgi:hypothetical protein
MTTSLDVIEIQMSQKITGDKLFETAVGFTDLWRRTILDPNEQCSYQRIGEKQAFVIVKVNCMW